MPRHLRRRTLARVACASLPLFLLTVVVAAQTDLKSTTQSQPQIEAASSLPSYSGVQTHIPGIYVTPVPESPFAARVDIVSRQILPDGQTVTRQTMNQIARDASGRIHNERRSLVPPGYSGEPEVLSTHIYDPATRLSVYLNPKTHIAREIVLRHPPATPAEGQPLHSANRDLPGVTEQDLGENPLNGITVHGLRRSRVVPADKSGTGKPVTIVDEYWYSTDLSIYLIIKHDDPRTGEQIVTVSQIDRREPDAALFSVPAGFKVADESPVE